MTAISIPLCGMSYTQHHGTALFGTIRLDLNLAYLYLSVNSFSKGYAHSHIFLASIRSSPQIPSSVHSAIHQYYYPVICSHIVWVCNTATPCYYPRNDKCDIATMDIYNSLGDHYPDHEQWTQIYSATNGQTHLSTRRGGRHPQPGSNHEFRRLVGCFE